MTQKLRDGWFPVGFGFSTLVPAVVRSWAPVLAILDSMKLVHLGSCVQDQRLLSEGRKRFLLAMNCLQSNLDHDPSMALPGLMLVSIGISMTEVSFLFSTPSQSASRFISRCEDKLNFDVWRRRTTADRLRSTMRYQMPRYPLPGRSMSSACLLYC